jgi:hypothetical protein
VGVSVGTNGVSVFEHAAGYLPSPLVHSATLDRWTHLAVVYQDKTPQLYLNGALVRTGLTSAQSLVYPSKMLGYNAAYGSYAGRLDEVSIYDRALGASEIAALYAAGSAGKCFAPATIRFTNLRLLGADLSLTSTGRVQTGATQVLQVSTNLALTNAWANAQTNPAPASTNTWLVPRQGDREVFRILERP